MIRMTRRLLTVALGAWLTCCVVGCAGDAEPDSDWHPSKVTAYTIPLRGTPPPWVVGDRPDPYGITTGPDGNMWFTEMLFNRVGKITPDGHVTDFSIYSGHDDSDAPEPGSIVSGGDDALWFDTGRGLGRMTMQGRVTMYPAAGDLTDDMVSNLAPAEDGVWVVHGYLGHVGKNGVLRWYKNADDARNHVQSVFVGPHHQVWALTQSFLRSPDDGDGWRLAVCKVLPNGSLRTVLTFTLPATAAGGPPSVSSIIEATDGTFWLSESGESSSMMFATNIDQVLKDGSVVRRATLPSAYHLDNGPGGTVLVQGIKYISRVARDGSLSTFYPHFERWGGQVLVVTTGPDGAIWFVIGDGTGRIGKIVP